MFSFEEKIIDATVEKLLSGEDYRQEVVNDINVKFLDFTLEFFKKIVDAKLNDEKINLDWYKKYFLSDENFDKSEIAKQNFDYLKNLIRQLEVDGEGELNIQIKITKNSVSVELNLSESLLVLNALATKKIALRGGAWSAIGKRVEKPLLIKLCELCGVDKKFYNAENFIRNKTKKFDREIDFKLYGNSGEEYFCEVKLMGGGNPESVDAVIARNSKIFIADTLSQQNKNQLDSLGIFWLEMKNHSRENILNQFRKILVKLKIPFAK